MSEPTAEPWVAQFVDGPAIDHERHFVVGPPWAHILLAPGVGAWRWIIVGGDGIPDASLSRWDGEAVYQLDRVDGVRSGEQLAYYRLMS